MISNIFIIKHACMHNIFYTYKIAYFSIHFLKKTLEKYLPVGCVSAVRFTSKNQPATENIIFILLL